MLIIGYDDTKERTIHGRHYKGFLECQNSWGEDYADHGFFWIPYEYITYRTKDLGMGFVMDMYTAIDLAREDLQGTAVELFIGKDKAFDDGKEISLDQPPIVDEKTGRTLVPALCGREPWMQGGMAGKEPPHYHPQQGARH